MARLRLILKPRLRHMHVLQLHFLLLLRLRLMHLPDCISYTCPEKISSNARADKVRIASRLLIYSPTVSRFATSRLFTTRVSSAFAILLITKTLQRHLHMLLLRVLCGRRLNLLL